MISPNVYADFMNADPQGRVRLNGVGTLNDLGDAGLRLVDGLRILVHDEELEADGVVSYSDQEKLWVAAIDWNAIRPFQKLVAATHA